MPDKMPSRTAIALGVAGLALLAVVGTMFFAPSARDDCRSAIFEATTAYRIEKAAESPACRGAAAP